jgi:hypothetical protein
MKVIKVILVMALIAAIATAAYVLFTEGQKAEQPEIVTVAEETVTAEETGETM